MPFINFLVNLAQALTMDDPFYHEKNPEELAGDQTLHEKWSTWETTC